MAGRARDGRGERRGSLGAGRDWSELMRPAGLAQEQIGTLLVENPRRMPTGE